MAAPSSRPSPRLETSDPGRLSIPLLRIDREFREAVPADELPLAERAVVVPGMRLARGAFDPGTLRADGGDALPALLIQGLVTMDVVLAGASTAHLYGPGDLLRPRAKVDGVVPVASRWAVSPDGAIVAVLDAAFARAAQRWPALTTALLRRYDDHADALVVRSAIAALPRVDERILALFWHLGERWGTMTADGVVIGLELTHEFVGRLVGAKRPTVSLALSDLARRDILSYQASSGWRLSPSSAALLDRPPSTRGGTPPTLAQHAKNASGPRAGGVRVRKQNAG